jgi:thioester reductase-like protein
MAYLLLTGATGLLGRYLLRDLLRRGRPVAVLVRPGKFLSARERIETVLQPWESDEGRAYPRPIVLAADLREPGLGLSESDLRWIADHCDSVLHSAASMVFRAQPDGEPHRTNVEGTRELLDLCRRAGIGQFHHVSTSYLCGLRTGRILESDLDVGQELGNVYEQSKLAGEKLVRAADWLEKYTVYRPASIVGDSRTGYTTSYHGFYLPLQLAYTMAGRIPPAEMGERFFARLGLRGDEGKNFVPVDWVAAAISELLSRPECHGGTYHLTSPRPVTVRLIQQIIQEAIQRWSKRTTATRASQRDLEVCERLFEQHMQVYQSHWRDDPAFDRANTDRALPHLPVPRMDYERMLLIARYPIEQNFASPRHQQVKLAFDAHRLFERWQNRSIKLESADRSHGCLSFEVTGSGGGQWSLRWRGDMAGIEAGLAPGEAGACYLTTQTLGRLVRGELSIADSIGTGRLVLEAPAGQHHQLLEVFKQVVNN